ncbi:hypothetical protein CBFG_03360 [Clostridiales bacterium 1_7_47FAA]|nr:hypothetical protein CBFG_03360 [Clostridiales bacterium 1_7_47FAA]
MSPVKRPTKRLYFTDNIHLITNRPKTEGITPDIIFLFPIIFDLFCNYGEYSSNYGQFKCPSLVFLPG